MNKRTRIGILFGGRSAEHEVSVQSARNVFEAINKEKYEVVLFGISRKGQWHLKEASELFLPSAKFSSSRPKQKGKGELIPLPHEGYLKKVDVVFPILHGPYGEDGTIQGLLELANIPYVGAGVLGSAVAMDKDVMKRLLSEAGIPVAKFLVINRASLEKIDFTRVCIQLGLPLFIKPANLGSSIGISKIEKEKEFQPALREAFRYDGKILIEECIEGREIECSVLGNYDPIASLPGEILPQRGFYSYEAKYLDAEGAILKVPAELPSGLVRKIQGLSLKVFRILGSQGMGRVDFFLKKSWEIIVSEINTIPGFTRISMYPRLWEASGISYSELIDRLIQLALERFEEKKKRV